MLLHAKSNAIGKHIDTISLKERYYHIKIVSLFFYFSVLLSSKKIRKATQEILHSLLYMDSRYYVKSFSLIATGASNSNNSPEGKTPQAS